jgi:hypothetical protein
MDSEERVEIDGEEENEHARHPEILEVTLTPIRLAIDGLRSIQSAHHLPFPTDCSMTADVKHRRRSTSCIAPAPFDP